MTETIITSCLLSTLLMIQLKILHPQNFGSDLPQIFRTIDSDFTPLESPTSFNQERCRLN